MSERRVLSGGTYIALWYNTGESLGGEKWGGRGKADKDGSDWQAVWIRDSIEGKAALGDTAGEAGGTGALRRGTVTVVT